MSTATILSHSAARVGEAPAQVGLPGAWPNPQEGRDVADRTCVVDGCERPLAYRRGWCRFHYRRWRLYGDPSLKHPKFYQTDHDRFWTKVDKGGPDECWIWRGAHPNGYGRFYVGTSRATNRSVPAHRWAYEELHGPVPPELFMDHLCRRPLCVNPSHLEPVTPRENSARSPLHHSGWTHCKRGHLLQGDNVRRTPAGRRRCIPCERAYAAARRASHRTREGS